MRCLLVLGLLGACRGGVDRTPPRRDIGLPPVPALPAEVQSFDAGAAAHLAALPWALPSGCSISLAIEPDRRVLRCTSRVALAPPSGWLSQNNGAVWRHGGLTLVTSWRRTDIGAEALQSLHQSSGDHPAGSPASSSPAPPQ